MFKMNVVKFPTEDEAFEYAKDNDVPVNGIIMYSSCCILKEVKNE
jgi:hypothetical protein